MNQNRHDDLNIHQRRRAAREHWGFHREVQPDTITDVQNLRRGKFMVQVAAASLLAIPAGVEVAKVGVDAFSDGQDKMLQDHFERYPELAPPSTTTVEVGPTVRP
jgi:hypothetical protein